LRALKSFSCGENSPTLLFFNFGRTSMRSKTESSVLALIESEREFWKAMKTGRDFAIAGTALTIVILCINQSPGEIEWHRPKAWWVTVSLGIIGITMIITHIFLRWRTDIRERKALSQICQCCFFLDIHNDIFHKDSSHVIVSCPLCEQTIFSGRVWDKNMNPNFVEQEPTIR
jgi:hypothetical protein